MIRVADYIVSELVKLGVDTVFTVTGRGALFLTDALAANEDMKVVCTHHEQAAAFAAVAYADQKSGFGACIVSTGCAGTNTITGILNAWQDNIPCIFIMGQNKLAETTRHTGLNIRSYGQQEADLVSMVSSITKYSTMISDPKKIGFELKKAAYLAQKGRPGPVWLEVPLDVQNMRIRPEQLDVFIPPKKDNFQANVGKAIDKLVADIELSQRPVILLGTGVHTAKAESELRKVVEIFEIPVVYASSAPDVYGKSNKLCIGSVGSMGCSRAGNFAVQNSDLLIVIGNRLNSFTTSEEVGKFARAAKIVVVDIDPIEHQKAGVSIDDFIHCDARVFLEQWYLRGCKKTDHAWVEKCQHWKQLFVTCEDSFQSETFVNLYQLADSLSRVLPEGSSLVTDSGLIELILPTNITFSEGQRCIHPASQGSMGAALPGAVGAYYASEGQIVCVVGDGSIMMNLQELETISFNKVPIKIFVVNNNAYSVIRRRQLELFGKRTIGTDPSNGVSCPDFSNLADTFKLEYFKIDSAKDLDDKLLKVLSSSGPALCEIMGVENQGYIASSYAKNQKGRLVRRPLEDQKPYLDRALFLKEMIIEPVDQ